MKNTLKQLSLLALGAVAAALIIGCGAKDDELGVGGKSIDKKALKALSIQGAPNWVLNAGQGDMSAVGDSDIVNGNIGYARTEALAKARTELAKQVEVEIEDVLKQSVSKVGGSEAQSTQLNETSEQITKQVTRQTLSGTRQTDTWITKDASRIFVLIKLSPELQAKLKANVKRAINATNLPTAVKQEAVKSVDSSFKAE